MSMAAICSALLAAAKPLTCAELAEAAGVDRQKVSTALWSLEKAGAIAADKVKGSPQTYTVANQDDVKRRADGARTGRPKGESKRRKKARAPKKTVHKPRRTKAVKRRTKRARRAKAAPPPERALAFFLSEDGEFQIIRQDGEGEQVFIGADDARAFAQFVMSLQR